LLSFVHPNAKKLSEFLYFLLVVYMMIRYFSGILTTIQTIREVLNPLWSAIVPFLLVVSQLFVSVLFPLAPFAAVAYSLFSLQFLESIIYPLLLFTTSITLLNRLDSESSFTRLTELARNLLIFLLFLLFTLFTAIITASGGLSWLLMDQLKPSLVSVVQNSIPLVGSLFTEGLSTVKGLASLSALTLGTTASITIGGMVAIPLGKLLLDAFVLRASGAILVIIGSERVGALLDDLGKLLFIMCAW